MNAGVSVQHTHSTFVEVKLHIILLLASLPFGYSDTVNQEVPQTHYIVVYSCVRRSVFCWLQCMLSILFFCLIVPPCQLAVTREWTTFYNQQRQIWPAKLIVCLSGQIFFGIGIRFSLSSTLNLSRTTCFRENFKDDLDCKCRGTTVDCKTHVNRNRLNVNRNQSVEGQQLIAKRMSMCHHIQKASG